MFTYWFFIPLFSVYLSLPIISLIPYAAKTKIYGFAASYAFLTISVLPVLCKLLGLHFNNDLTTLVSAGFLIYVLLGYLLEYGFKLDFHQRIAIYILVWLGNKSLYFV